MLVVSPLLRELIHALDNSTGPPLSASREHWLSALVLDEIAHADRQALGVPLPHPHSGDKRLRALCEAVLRAPCERTVARLFREQLGMSYQQWRQQAILAHALPMLARGQSVGAVAAASESAFSAMFKAAMGQSPRAFQK